MVHLGGVQIDCGGGLGAKVAVPGLEIVCIDAMFAADTLELYPPYHVFSGVVSQDLIVVVCPRKKNTPQWAVESNVAGRIVSTSGRTMH